MTLTLLRWRVAAATVVVLVGLAVFGLVRAARDDRGGAPRPVAGSASTPTTRTPTPTPTTPLPVAATSSAPQPPPPPPSAPARKPHHETVAIPSQHVTAPIDVCQIINGGLEPPANVHRTCYWAGGARVGASTGTTVITGHINWVGQGTGALGNIWALHRGDVVRTSDAQGRTTTWTVTKVSYRPKTHGIDPDAFVGRSGPRRLYLVSCGGAFDPADSSYADNVYVQARPVSAAPATSATPDRFTLR